MNFSLINSYYSIFENFMKNRDHWWKDKRKEEQESFKIGRISFHLLFLCLLLPLLLFIITLILFLVWYDFGNSFRQTRVQKTLKIKFRPKISSLNKINTSWKDEKRKQTCQILKFYKNFLPSIVSISLC